VGPGLSRVRVERRGSPVVAFIRIDDKQIYDKSRIYAPDDVVVVDPTLVEAIDITEGLKPGGTIIINSDRRPEDFPFHGKFKVRTINATEIAVKYGWGAWPPRSSTRPSPGRSSRSSAWPSSSPWPRPSGTASLSSPRTTSRRPRKPTRRPEEGRHETQESQEDRLQVG